MVKVNSTHVLLDAVTAATTGTAISYKNTEKANVQVDYTTTGGTVVIAIEGSNAATSTGSFGTINTKTTTGDTACSYFVEISGPYRYVRGKTSSYSTTGTGTAVTATMVTQGQGC